MADHEGNGVVPEEDGDAHNLEESITKARSGKVTGVIYPPPDIRAVADKTAQWVAKNGRPFEQRILNSEEGKSSKFNFMKPGDPYYAYYEFKIRQFEEGKVEPPEKKAKIEKPAEPAAKEAASAPATAAPVTAAAGTTTVGKASVLGPIARAALNKPSEPPAPMEFILTHPESLSALDVEVIKLTAQYTAASGRQFLAGLAQREQRNPQFDFLKPTNPLFSYFTSLVDAYTKILQPTAPQKARIADSKDKMKVLERAVHRWEHEKAGEEKKRAQQAEADAERIAYQTLDWHDFVTVETITFAEDELLDVGMPGAGGDEEEEEEEQEPARDRREVPPPPPPPSRGLVDDGGDDMDMDMDMDDDLMPAPPSGAPPPPPPPPPPRPPAPDMDGEEGEDIRVVADYTPRIATGPTAPTTMLDPVSGRQVPISQVGEHMRIQFLDPRWREEQRRNLEKKKETAFAEGLDIAANVRKFAEKRTDIFGSVEDEERAIVQDQQNRRKREEEANRIIWDGSLTSVPLVQQKTVEKMVEQMHRGPYLQHNSLQPSIGPSATSVAPPRAMPPPPPAAPTQTYTTMQNNSFGMPPPPPPTSSYQPPPPSQPMVQQQPPPPPPDLNDDEDVDMEVEDFGSGLVAESDFAARISGAVPLSIQAPVDESNPSWNLRGQVLGLRLAGVMSTIKELKEQLSPLLGAMPPGKMQLRHPTHGFLKDQQTLASYNIGANSLIELLPRSRGGRR